MKLSTKIALAFSAGVGLMLIFNKAGKDDDAHYLRKAISACEFVGDEFHERAVLLAPYAGIDADYECVIYNADGIRALRGEEREAYQGVFID